MGPVRPLNVRVERYFLRWRTWLGRDTAIHYLDLLDAAVWSKGYRTVKLYRADEFPTRPPLLWVFAFSPDRHVRAPVNVRATPGGTWGYYEAGRGRHGYLSPCGDTKHAAEQLDGLLKHRMFPSTW
ncbi:hypothetical protein ETD83_17705 [Actinomadura soli]|uniref:Uncharacterized protein n=1 Tax=Actinomadura soli TaxID=2508997 RepID=A0A5C4JAS8_9ACTN|nr:hypothetical protein [Actinomadura soli]TMR00003.1 hypothetical protein ETD83_17705 [Actinomadura soli]